METILNPCVKCFLICIFIKQHNNNVYKIAFHADNKFHHQTFHYETYTHLLFVCESNSYSSRQNKKGLLKIDCFLVRCYLFFKFTFFEEATWLHFQRPPFYAVPKNEAAHLFFQRVHFRTLRALSFQSAPSLFVFSCLNLFATAKQSTKQSVRFDQTTNAAGDMQSMIITASCENLTSGCQIALTKPTLASR